MKIAIFNKKRLSMKKIHVSVLVLGSFCAASCGSPKSAQTSLTSKTPTSKPVVTTTPTTPASNPNKILFTQTLMTQSAYQAGEKPKVKVEISEGFTAQWSTRVNRLMPDGSFDQVDSVITAVIPPNSPGTIVDFIDTKGNGRFVRVEIPSVDGTVLWAFFKENPETNSAYTLCVKDDKDKTKNIAWATYKNEEVKLTISTPDPTKPPTLWVNLKPRNVEINITNSKKI
jgi:hypothetical protein